MKHHTAQNALSFARTVPFLVIVAILCASVRAMPDGTDGCRGSGVITTPGGSPVLRCAKVGCGTTCTKLDVILVFPDEHEEQAQICNCDGTPDDNCCAIALTQGGQIVGTGRCKDSNPGDSSCPDGQHCLTSVPTPDEYPQVISAYCHG